MAASKHPGGRPPKYKTKEEIQEKIDQYFEDCKGKPFIDPATGQVLRDKYGYPVMVNVHIPTVTGLALSLGFTNRVSLLNYQGRKEFKDTIEKAKTRIEAYVEERLFDKDGSNGARFSLQNNFKGWDADKPKPEESKAPAINIICDIPRTQDVVKQPQTEDNKPNNE